MEKIFNLFEAALWGLVAGIFAIRAMKETPKLRRISRSLALTFLAFGMSDLVEAHTGAWWQPWWLAAWKIGCVAILVWSFCRYFTIRKHQR